MSEADSDYVDADAESALHYLHREVSADERSSLQVHENTAEALELLKGRLNAGANDKIATVDDVVRLALLTLSRYQYTGEHDVTATRILRELQPFTEGISETADLHGELIGRSEEYNRLMRDPVFWIPDEVPRSEVEAIIEAYFDNPEKYKDWPGVRHRTDDTRP